MKNLLHINKTALIDGFLTYFTLVPGQTAGCDCSLWLMLMTEKYQQNFRHPLMRYFGYFAILWKDRFSVGATSDFGCE